MTNPTESAKIEDRNSKLETGNSVVAEAASSVAVAEIPTMVGPVVVEEDRLTVDNRPSSIPLLLEVGCEEIPARFLRDAEKGLGERVQSALRQARLLDDSGSGVLVESAEPPVPLELSARAAATYSTPRRLVVHVPFVRVQQPVKVEEILGPPVKVAIDRDGNYTRAAESFVQKNSGRLQDLTRTTTPKGEYLSLKKTTPGRPALEVLPEILPGAILGLSFPKSMYWTQKLAPHFVRPIRWMVALLGKGEQAATLKFEFLGVKAGDFTFGHRAKSPGSIPVSGLKDYTNKLAETFVEIDYNSRKLRIVEEARTVATEAGGKIVADEWLADWTANSTEWPRPMLGSFDPRFLHLPREILITVMRDHQRYFAVEDEQGSLRPHFVAVLNMDSDEKGLIRQGHQRVLTARFRDAEFFWAADQRIPLRERRPLLDKVTYQEKLGSYGDKIRRMKSIADSFCVLLEVSGGLKSGQAEEVMRAIDLCKCDLTTQMVQEFTELQGVVGGLYAKTQGEPEAVSTAVYDHYLPLGAEGDAPRTLVGALVSLADKMDSVVAGFAAGHEPTGSSDPFALRRQANGAVKVILENSIPIGLKETINRALEVLDIQWRKPREEVRAKVLDFFAERLRYYFEAVRGFRYDTVRAVVAAGADQPTDALARAGAMESLRGGDDFEALSAAAKRIRNILAKSATAADWQAGEVAPGILSEAEEKELYQAYERIAGEVERRRGNREYRQALEEISALRPAVDRFFDKVLVMAEDRQVRQNRLRLLKKLDDLFSGIAHFAEIAEKL